MLTVHPNRGIADPPKSCCVNLPHRRNPQWQRQKALYPQDHKRAVEIGKVILEHDLQSGHSGVWLHESRKPLDEIDFFAADTPELFVVIVAFVGHRRGN